MRNGLKRLVSRNQGLDCPSILSSALELLKVQLEACVGTPC